MLTAQPSLEDETRSHFSKIAQPGNFEMRSSGNLSIDVSGEIDQILYEALRTLTSEANELQLQLHDALSALKEAAILHRPTTVTSSYAEFADEIVSAFHAEALEDGHYHPVEAVLQQAQDTLDADVLGQWIEMAISRLGEYSGESLLRCLGRIEGLGTPKWRGELLAKNLSSRSMAFRDAAVQAGERWGGEEVVEVLAKHADPEPWLQEYIDRLVHELRG